MFRLFSFLNRFLFSEEKKYNIAKSIQWFSLFLVQNLHPDQIRITGT